jgi:arsenate reductase-like glutaredoxin family protein
MRIFLPCEAVIAEYERRIREARGLATENIGLRQQIKVQKNATTIHQRVSDDLRATLITREGTIRRLNQEKDRLSRALDEMMDEKGELLDRLDRLRAWASRL